MALKVRFSRRIGNLPYLPAADPLFPMFIRHFKDATPQVNGQSELRHLMAYDTARSGPLLAFTQAVMRSDGALPPGERELLAAMLSKENHCLF
jgi:alkylhydroperoxidase family enzyme